jgi:4-amino-4-deoxy-L-arabinose transferase-like glycosyltransferase
MIMQARLAESDIVLCLLTTFALYMIAADLTCRDADRPSGGARLQRFLSWTAIYAVLGLSTLAKEIVGPVLVVFTTSAFIVIQRQWRSLWSLANPAGLALFAVLALAWPLTVGREYPEIWTIWYRQSFGRALGGLDQEPFWFYAVNIPWLMLPWAPVTALAAVGSWKKAWSGADRRERFLWVWFLSQVLFLTLSIGKHKHYVIPALPALSLITGPGLERLVERIKKGDALPTVRQVAWSSFLWVLIVSASIVAVAHKWPELVFPFAPAVALCGLGGCLALWLWHASRLREAALAALFVFVVCYSTVFGSLLPARDPRRPAAQFARRVSSVAPVDQPTIVYDMSTTPVVFYLSRPAIRADTNEQLRDHLATRKTIFVLTKRTQIEELEKIAEVRRIDEMKPARESYLKDSPLLILLEMTARSPN